jgi:hypothetical protein
MTDVIIMKSTLMLLLILTLLPLSVYSDNSDLYFIDAHSQVDSQKVLQRIIPLMDKAGVRLTILSGRRKLLSGDIADFAEQHPQRIIASV